MVILPGCRNDRVFNRRYWRLSRRRKAGCTMLYSHSITWTCPHTRLPQSRWCLSGTTLRRELQPVDLLSEWAVSSSFHRAIHQSLAAGKAYTCRRFHLVKIHTASYTDNLCPCWVVTVPSLSPGLPIGVSTSMSPATGFSIPMRIGSHPPHLVDFLESGTPPVYIGFGSMVNRTPRQTDPTRL